MHPEMHKVRTWALVADSAQARILCGLEEAGPGAEVPAELVITPQYPGIDAAYTDKPGRSFASGSSGRRSAVEESTDLVQAELADFAREIATLLDQHRQAGDFGRLAVFAGEKMLGHLRKAMPAGLQGAVFVEQAINLAQLSEHELRQRVQNLIAAPRA